MLLETLFVALWANAVWLLDALAELWFDGQLCFHWCFGGVVLTLHFSFFNFYFFFLFISAFTIFHRSSFSMSWDFAMLTYLLSSLVSNMLNKLSGQPESYEKKYAPTPFLPDI